MEDVERAPRVKVVADRLPGGAISMIDLNSSGAAVTVMAEDGENILQVDGKRRRVFIPEFELAEECQIDTAKVKARRFAHLDEVLRVHKKTLSSKIMIRVHAVAEACAGLDTYPTVYVLVRSDTIVSSGKGSVLVANIGIMATADQDPGQPGIGFTGMGFTIPAEIELRTGSQEIEDWLLVAEIMDR